MTAPPSAQPRGLSVVACSYALPPERLCALLAGIGSRLNMPMTGVVVCNGPHALPAAIAGWSFIKGSNDDLDFSAYREGLAWLSQAGTHDPGAVLFANDSLFTKHNARRIMRDLLAQRGLLAAIDGPAIAGKTDPYDNICYASPWSGLPIYVSSFCFLLNGAALPMLAALGPQADADLGPVQLDVADPSWGAALAKGFRAYLQAHLLHLGNSVSWYQLRHQAANRPLISRKARCVYCEHRLSGEIGRRGVIIALYPRLRMKTRFFVFEQLAKLVRALGLPA